MSVNTPTSGSHAIDLHELDLEQWSEEHPGEAAPKCPRYRIRIDREHYVVDVPEMTGRALLALAGKQPIERYAIYQKLHGGETKRIGLDETVSFRQPGVERFVTLPLDQTEGDQLARRAFRLPGEDERFLNSLGVPWETVIEGKQRRVVIHQLKVPPGYNRAEVVASLHIEELYPDTQIDMVYVHPALVRRDGRSLKAVANNTFDGKMWQRWSRHRSEQNKWRPGVDNIETHLLCVQHWLEKELER